MDAARMGGARVLTMPTPDRRALHFAETVRKSFTFLAAHGVDLVESGPTLVLFESGQLYVNVYHGRKSFELGLEIGPLKTTRSTEAPFSMSEIIRLVEPEMAERYRDYAARTAEGVGEGVRRLALLFHRYVDGGLLRDPGLFVRLDRQRAALSEDFERKVNTAQIRRKLDEAWHAKDYPGVVGLLERIGADLTPSERKKLAFAKKRLQQAP